MDLDYNVPSWSSLPTQTYRVEVLKNGVVIEEFTLPKDREYVVLGRLPECDISMEHGSVSRHHALLQFGSDRIHLYDLGSTHGTWLGKSRIDPGVHVALPPGALMRFGESTRAYVVSAVPEEEAPAWEGNPTKYLRDWLIGQGEDPEFQADEADGQFIGTITVYGGLVSADRDLVFQGHGHGKKDALKAAAMQACEQLDQLGAFAKQSTKRTFLDHRQEGREVDTFFDRTAKAKKPRESKVETLESLLEQQARLEALIADLRASLASSTSEQCTDEQDELEMYMIQIQSDQASKDRVRHAQELGDAEAALGRVEGLLGLFEGHATAKRPNFVAKSQEHVVEEHAVEEHVVEEHVEIKEHVEEVEGHVEMKKHVEEVEEWLPPDQPESKASLDLKAKYGY